MELKEEILKFIGNLYDLVVYILLKYERWKLGSWKMWVEMISIYYVFFKIDVYRYWLYLLWLLSFLF